MVIRAIAIQAGSSRSGRWRIKPLPTPFNIMQRVSRDDLRTGAIFVVTEWPSVQTFSGQSNVNISARTETDRLRRRRERRGDRRDRVLMKELILSASQDEFAEFGLNGARVDRIALRVGASKNLIYHFSETKINFISRCLKAFTGRCARQNDLALQKIFAGRRYATAGRQYLRAFRRVPALVRLMSIENIDYARHLKQSTSVKPLYAPLLETMRVLLARGEEAASSGRMSTRSIFTYRLPVSPISIFQTAIRCPGFLTRSWMDRLQPAQVAVEEVLADREVGEPGLLPGLDDAQQVAELLLGRRPRGHVGDQHADPHALSLRAHPALPPAAAQAPGKPMKPCTSMRLATSTARPSRRSTASQYSPQPTRTSGPAR